MSGRGGGGISVPSGQQPRSDGRGEPVHVESPKATYACCRHCVHLRPVVHRASCRVCPPEETEGLVRILP